MRFSFQLVEVDRKWSDYESQSGYSCTLYVCKPGIMPRGVGGGAQGTGAPPFVLDTRGLC